LSGAGVELTPFETVEELAQAVNPKLLITIQPINNRVLRDINVCIIGLGLER
jgi:hypothetical protein